MLSGSVFYSRRLDGFEELRTMEAVVLLSAESLPDVEPLLVLVMETRTGVTTAPAARVVNR